MATASGLMVAPAARAQVTLTPYVGSFYSASKLAKVVNNSDPTVVFTAEQSNTAVYGARLTIPIGQVLALEGTFGFARSDVFLVITNFCVDGFGGTSDCLTSAKANVLIGSARLQFRPRRSNLHFMVGGSMVRHSGDEVWGGLNELTDFGAVVGIELSASITPKLPLTLAAEGNIYAFDPDGTGSVFESKTQSDLLFTVGVPIKLTH
jgi:hypothetical protein